MLTLAIVRLLFSCCFLVVGCSSLQVAPAKPVASHNPFSFHFPSSHLAPPSTRSPPHHRRRHTHPISAATALQPPSRTRSQTQGTVASPPTTRERQASASERALEAIRQENQTLKKEVQIHLETLYIIRGMRDASHSLFACCNSFVCTLLLDRSLFTIDSRAIASYELKRCRTAPQHFADHRL
jgi:hypothetical protein